MRHPDEDEEEEYAWTRYCVAASGGGEYAAYAMDFRQRLQEEAHFDPLRCVCSGRGWVLSDLDVWVPCPWHQAPHPEDPELEHEPAEASHNRRREMMRAAYRQYRAMYAGPTCCPRCSRQFDVNVNFYRFTHHLPDNPIGWLRAAAAVAEGGE